ncbi:MAG TPA: DUF882 domain-containing protein [Vicinamibacteria bacterium]|nr:DUF882 domain-containing protein [Vicinamibacteria bacterium]
MSSPDADRRQFLSAAGLTGAWWLLGRTAFGDAERRPRSLSFLNTHTAEKVTAVYWADGEYQPAALAAINRVLRDHRTGLVKDIDRRLLDVLHSLRLDLGTTAPFHVISCYRAPQSNALLRRRGRAVAEKSLHMEGKAADVRLPGVKLDDLHQVAVARKAGGVGYYPGPSFVHVDVGRVRYW